MRRLRLEVASDTILPFGPRGREENPQLILVKHSVTYGSVPHISITGHDTPRRDEVPTSPVPDGHLTVTRTGRRVDIRMLQYVTP